MFNRIFEALARKGGEPDRLMIDATHLKAHPTAASLPAQKGAKRPKVPPMHGIGGKAAEGVPRHIGRTKGGLNSKLHAVCDGKGRPIVMLLSEGQCRLCV